MYSNNTVNPLEPQWCTKRTLHLVFSGFSWTEYASCRLVPGEQLHLIHPKCSLCVPVRLQHIHDLPDQSFTPLCPYLICLRNPKPASLQSCRSALLRVSLQNRFKCRVGATPRSSLLSHCSTRPWDTSEWILTTAACPLTDRPRGESVQMKKKQEFMFVYLYTALVSP